MLAMDMTVPLDASFLAAPLDSSSPDTFTGEGGEGVVLAAATLGGLDHTEFGSLYQPERLPHSRDKREIINSDNVIAEGGYCEIVNAVRVETGH